METPKVALLPDDCCPWLSETESRRTVQRNVASGVFGRSTRSSSSAMPKLKTLDGEDTANGEDVNDTPSMGQLQLHLLHRRRLYKLHATNLSSLSDSHYFYQLMMWCHDQNVFVNSCVRIQKCRSDYRQHSFFVNRDIPRLTPLVAVPERLAIGFMDSNDREDANNLHDAEREKEFNKLNSGGGDSDSDICSFFFSALGMIVADLMTARSSKLSDPRSKFADLLSKVQTLANAPYFEDSVVFDPDEPCLADVLLQMIRNYVNGGPLVNRVSRQELLWAVSVCLSHSTPLTVGTTPSIGIIPMVHLFPHGGKETNSFVIARSGREMASEKMNCFFRTQFDLDFSALHEEKWIYVVNDTPLTAGEEIRLQAMAPVCDKDSEAEQMWRLSCGVAPAEYLSSAEVSRKQVALTEEIIQKGSIFLDRK
ncbi:hypothetical protein, conserved [Angomonas deanei]|uniref:Uncharacterized protein n=1 Tax=Angomonas deanei TaxID=59799 RepID=A0A7G2CA55_9TRYP|nr:hypothetical protein, conserved [Angomonas deanei]